MEQISTFIYGIHFLSGADISMGDSPPFISYIYIFITMVLLSINLTHLHLISDIKMAADKTYISDVERCSSYLTLSI